MSHETTVLLLAIAVMLSPFLGLPYSWLMVIVPLLGIAIAILSVLMRMRQMAPPEAVPPLTPSFDETPSIA